MWEECDTMSESSTSRAGDAAAVARARKIGDGIASLGDSLERMEASGSSGDHLVTATVSGRGRLAALDIDPAGVDPDDLGSLAERVVAAVNNALDDLAVQAGRKLEPVKDDIEAVLAGLRSAGFGPGGSRA
jgi:nucleoid-associated protein EbfC